MRVAVVDDEKNCRDLLCAHLRKSSEETGEPIEILVFSNGVDFASDYKANCDVIFLDVEMPLMDGLATAKKIREFDGEVSIIFVTNYSQYAINGYEVNAVDYVMKPLSYFVFCAKFKKALNLSQRKAEKEIVISRENSIVRTSVNKIYYLTSDKNYVVYHTADGEYKERGTMTHTRDKFTGLNFANCTAGCLVNLAYVTKVTQHEVHLKDVVLPLSRPQKKEFTKKYIDYLSKGTS